MAVPRARSARSAPSARSARRLLPVPALLLALGLAACGGSDAAPPAAGEAPEVIRFGIGPYQPTVDDTRTAYEPFFAYVAEQLGSDYELDVTTDFAGISVALANDQVDVAWLGPYGYVLSEQQAGTSAVATVEYDGKPTYRSIVVARPDSTVQNWPDDAEGQSISFAEVASTSGWLVPTYFLQQQGIDPKTYFDYSEGGSHASQNTAVASGRVDLATDYDRNRNALIESGALEPDATKVVWESEPLPNDAIAVREGFDPELARRLTEIMDSITPEQALELLPEHYTGFTPADQATYAPIRDAAAALGQ